MDLVYDLGDTTDPVTKNPAGDQWPFLNVARVRGHMPFGTPPSEVPIGGLILDD